MRDNLTWHMVPIKKKGYDKGDLLQSTENDTIKTSTSVYMLSSMWQSMQLVVCSEFLPIDMDKVYDDRTEEIYDYDQSEELNPTDVYRIIASYPHISGTTDFAPYINEFIEAHNRGGVQVEYDTMQVDSTQPEIRKMYNGNPVFRITPTDRNFRVFQNTESL